MFHHFEKIPRWTKGAAISEKIDGTNAQIHIFRPWEEENPDAFDIEMAIDVQASTGYVMLAGSRNRYITPEDDNMGFAVWCKDNAAELWKLGPGRHYGEWFGEGIQKNPLNVEGKRLAMFNPRWADQGPDCVEVVPQLGLMQDFISIDETMEELKRHGTYVEGGSGQAEGIIIYHLGSGQLYKATFDNPEGKWSA